jgi:hydroxyethylthiazole kinase-like uncharacterized protein yjeF
MENAGRGAGDVLRSLGIDGPVVICCGKGNNGGDGLVIARHLANAGNDVRVLLFADPSELSVDAAIQWNIVQKMGLWAEIWAERDDEPKLDAVFSRAAWIVDALFGTGLTGPVRTPFDRVIEVMNASTAKVLAVDIPSGLDANTGQPQGVRRDCSGGAHRNVRRAQGGIQQFDCGGIHWPGPCRRYRDRCQVYLRDMIFCMALASTWLKAGSPPAAR